jgi:23S rRNA pseudouridine1911/1915/1917 synthase
MVFVDGVAARKSGQMIAAGMAVELRVPASAPSGLRGEMIPLDIVFENQDVLVVNKPAGMVVHPAAGHASGTLVNAALGYDPHMLGIGGEARPGVVHRLDKDTSGLVVLAKNDRALHWLQQQFSKRLVNKTYVALVDGKPPSPSGRVDAAIGRDSTRRKQMAVLPEGRGREASSFYRTLESFPLHTLLEFHPLTGRTHQIRVHCRFLGCPVVGDTVYGHRTPSIPIRRHFLHALRIGLVLPGQSTPSEFEAPLPDDLHQVLDSLRQQAGSSGHAKHNKETTWSL